jgi:hypothetical protein
MTRLHKVAMNKLRQLAGVGVGMEEGDFDVQRY